MTAGARKGSHGLTRRGRRDRPAVARTPSAVPEEVVTRRLYEPDRLHLQYLFPMRR